MIATQALRRWIKAQDTPLAGLLYRAAKGARVASLPCLPALHRSLYAGHRLVAAALAGIARMAWWTPLFQSRLTRPAPRLLLQGGMPLVTGPVRLEIGADCRISGKITISGRTRSAAPTLVVGRNVDLGWQTTIAVGRRITIGDNVRIAGQAFLAGYPGHPIDARRRALGDPDDDAQVGDIAIEDDVWLATGVTVIGPARIGARTIVAAGSVVTGDLPPDVLAAGVPARPVRLLTADGGL